MSSGGIKAMTNIFEEVFYFVIDGYTKTQPDKAHFITNVFSSTLTK